ncbi:MAG: dynamin family protein [Hyphomonadaceae bacterium]|jgi:GTPase Era involved in 16S rRNA processing|nr:dynamin family protein [Hyphomonadaceae bacterium]
MSADADIGTDARSSRPGRARIVVVGEFNSGKTTLVNALVGAPVLTPSAVARTAHPTVVGFAPKPSLSAETTDRRRMPVAWDGLDAVAPGDIRRLHVGVPLERLKRLSVVDTPGLGLADGESDRRSLQACRTADAVIWCTPAMQAWKASEEQTWRALPERVRARGLLAVTFADAIASPADMDRLMQRLSAEAGPYFRRVAMASELGSLTAGDAAVGTA